MLKIVFQAVFVWVLYVISLKIKKETQIKNETIRKQLRIPDTYGLSIQNEIQKQYLLIEYWTRTDRKRICFFVDSTNFTHLNQ